MCKVEVFLDVPGHPYVLRLVLTFFFLLYLAVNKL